MILLRLLFGVAVVSWSLGFGPPQVRGEPACRVVQQEKRVELCSPFFAFRLDTSDGLRAVSWENRLTGRKLSLGNGPEVELDIGLPNQPLTTPKLRVVKVARGLDGRERRGGVRTRGGRSEAVGHGDAIAGTRSSRCCGSSSRSPTAAGRSGTGC